METGEAELGSCRLETREVRGWFHQDEMGYIGCMGYIGWHFSGLSSAPSLVKPQNHRII